MQCTAPKRGHRPGSKRSKECPACNPRARKRRARKRRARKKKSNQSQSNADLLDDLKGLEKRNDHLLCLAMDLAACFLDRQREELEAVRRDWDSAWNLLQLPGQILKSNANYLADYLLPISQVSVAIDSLKSLSREMCPDTGSHEFLS